MSSPKFEIFLTFSEFLESKVFRQLGRHLVGKVFILATKLRFACSESNLCEKVVKSQKIITRVVGYRYPKLVQQLISH